MKRCPTCNRVETDDALGFCRVDGTALVKSLSSDITNNRGPAAEIETRILPGTTEAGIARATAGAAILVGQPHAKSSVPRRSRLFPVVVVIAIVAALAPFIYISRKRTTPIDSVAVLPFQNASEDPNSEYLADGIAEALINSLTQLRQLRVIARTTAFHYKGQDVDPRKIGRELNVRAVLTGRVRQLGDNLNVQVDLIDATTGAQLWGQEYERNVSDALWIKQAIAQEVKENLRLNLSGEDEERFVQGEPKNGAAYQAYLRGRYFWNQRGADRLTKALREFQRSIELDPTFALGYVGIADCYVVQEESAGIPASDSLPKARAAADRALQLDDSSAEAHTSSAMIYQHLWRWSEAEKEYRRAINLNPNYPTAHQWYSNFLFASRRLDEALQEGKLAQQLDPLAPIISHNVAFIYLLKNDPASAISVGQKALELNPNFPALLNDIGWAYVKQRRYDEAAAQFLKAIDSSGRASTSLGNLGYCFAISGRRVEALAIAKELESRYAEGKSVAVFLAGVYAGLGDKDKAFALLEKDFQQHSGQIPAITFWMSIEPLRADPRYVDLVRRIWNR